MCRTLKGALKFLYDGENILRAHRRHLYQILANEKGIPHWKISLGYGLLQLLVGLTVLLLRPLGVITILALLAVWFGGFIVVSSIVRKRVAISFYPRRRPQARKVLPALRTGSGARDQK